MKKETEETLPDKGKEAEQLVSTVASKSYLKYWCYENPIDQDGDKKEICDLLIPFYDTLIIISVKNYTFEIEKAASKAKERYNTKVVEKSTKQLFGAERRMRQKESILIKEQNTDKSLSLNMAQFSHIFRITVNMGSQFENYELIDSQDDKGTVSILNKDSFECIFNELDTIKDLTEYLAAREVLLQQNGSLINCSEKDLVAYFLMNKREFPDDFSKISFKDWTDSIKGKWDNYNQHESVFLKRQADVISYFIDNFIENDILKSKLFTTQQKDVFAKELMTLSRLDRRIIGSNWTEMIKKYQGTENDYSRRWLIDNNQTMFLYIYYGNSLPQESLDDLLSFTAEIHAYVHKVSKVMYLAATDSFKQYKYGLLEFEDNMSELSDEQIKLYQDAIAEFGWFQNQIITHSSYSEYPDETD